MFKRKPPKRLEIFLNDIPVEIVRKKVKNINLRVYPSKRRVKISAPWYVRTESVIEFAKSRQGWIQKHLENYREPLHLEPPKFENGEIHRYRGEEFRLVVDEHDAPPEVVLLENERVLKMTVRTGSGRNKRARLKEEIPS